MIRTTVALLAIAVIAALAGCGVGNDIPFVDNPTITVTAVTDTTISISWQPAANEASVGRGYLYEVYTSASAMTSPDDLDSLTPSIAATADELGEDALAAPISGLTVGTGYHINVAVVNRRSGDMELYDDVIGVTSGVGLTFSDTGADPYFNHSIDTSGASRVVEYTIDLGASSDVYIVFSNPAAADLVRPEILLGSLSGIESSTWPAANVAPPTAPAARSVTTTGPIILRDRPEIVDWQAPSLSPAGRGIAPPPNWAGMDPDFDYVGRTGDFYDDSVSNTISAVCRVDLNDDGFGNGLSIWVQETEWEGNGGAVTEPMLTNLANSFLSSVSDDDDIFDWLTSIYGDEWGSHLDGKLIPNQDHVTILLYDIPSPPNTIIVGYFWNKDNHKASYYDFSNERVMFYINSTALVDFYEDTVVTLAHEFQHMIHYYQRRVLLGAVTQTWLNEMMSLVSEDLVGHKLYTGQGLDIAGPRGVLPSWGTESGGAGDSNNVDGRLPLYNANPSINLTTWLSGEEVLKSYSIAYAFGAFLSRNFGGAKLLQAMMDSTSSNSETVISSAIEAAGGPAELAMDDLLWRWGVSVLLSDDPTVQSQVEMNTGGWFGSTVNATTYDLGSINHFNYNPAGPVIHTASSYPLAEMEGMSTIFYELGLGQTGALTATLLVPNGVDFTVVVK